MDFRARLVNPSLLKKISYYINSTYVWTSVWNMLPGKTGSETKLSKIHIMRVNTKQILDVLVVVVVDQKRVQQNAKADK